MRPENLENKIDIFQSLVGALCGSDGGAVSGVVPVVSPALAQDMKTLDTARFLFTDSLNSADFTVQLVDALRRWHVSGQRPSATALCALACLRFEIEAPDLRQAVLMASLLAEVPHMHPYHNNAHFFEVLIHTIRIISAHNEIYAGTSRVLTLPEMALLLVSACIHDYAHDGVGNIVRGHFAPGRLEDQSFSQVAPYLRLCGLSVPDLARLRVMLLCTDVSPLGDPESYMRQMKAAYRFHFTAENRKMARLHLSPELALLEQEPALSQLALILHEADIATSAGLDYGLTQFETGLYRREIGLEAGRPSHVLDFLEQVCLGQFMSTAAQKLYASNMARIQALAEEDFRDGNVPFPAPDETDFMRGVFDFTKSRRVTLN